MLVAFACDGEHLRRIADPIPGALRGAAWIDLISPSAEESSLVQAATSLAVPTEAKPLRNRKLQPPRRRRRGAEAQHDAGQPPGRRAASAARRLRAGARPPDHHPLCPKPPVRQLRRARNCRAQRHTAPAPTCSSACWRRSSIVTPTRWRKSAPNSMPSRTASSAPIHAIGGSKHEDRTLRARWSRSAVPAT